MCDCCGCYFFTIRQHEVNTSYDGCVADHYEESMSNILHRDHNSLNVDVDVLLTAHHSINPPPTTHFQRNLCHVRPSLATVPCTIVEYTQNQLNFRQQLANGMSQDIVYNV